MVLRYAANDQSMSNRMDGNIHVSRSRTIPHFLIVSFFDRVTLITDDPRYQTAVELAPPHERRQNPKTLNPSHPRVQSSSPAKPPTRRMPSSSTIVMNHIMASRTSRTILLPTERRCTQRASICFSHSRYVRACLKIRGNARNVGLIRRVSF